MSNKIISVQKIGFIFETDSPFLACMHHQDHYPAGNEQQGPVVTLNGRQLGQDFSAKDGFSMYHGETVPGFPAHPHRGFETVTVVPQGIVDHFDSKGAEGRYGNGDVQWLTTGSGCQHAEIFPLVNTDRDNPLELFQIWLNLPAKDKFAEPDYKMLWSEDIPSIKISNDIGKTATVKLIAGTYQGVDSLTPPVASWANKKENHVGIMLIEMEPESVIKLPAGSKTMLRSLYVYKGDSAVTIDGQLIHPSHRIKLSGSEEIEILNGDQKAYLLLLEGEPINEPVVQHGPFVMNTSQEIQEAFRDYKTTEFGGWPWSKHELVHERNTGRFARHADGNVEKR